MSEYVSLKALADDLGLDRSNMRKYVLKHGFVPLSVRTPDSRHQSTLALQPDDAEAVRQLRNSQGFGAKAAPIENGKGFLYVVQVVPDLAPNRVKLGFANDVITRLSAHQTAAPTAILVKSWPCKRSWEGPAVESITRAGCLHLANEVYECDALPALVGRGDAFFAIMPSVS